MPASRHSSRSLSLALAVIATMGTSSPRPRMFCGWERSTPCQQCLGARLFHPVASRSAVQGSTAALQATGLHDQMRCGHGCTGSLY